MHGLTMIFFFIIPMTTGAFGNYLLPLMIGARDMAFPRMNALSYWIFLASGIFLYSSLALGTAPNAGWFDYVPLASRTYDPGHAIDFYCLGIIFNGIASTLTAGQFIVTIFKSRAPGMSLNRMPLFCFAFLAASFGLLFALPVLSRGHDHALPRPQRRHALLRRRARRLGAALAAPVLVLRPPRGLHPDRPRVRDRDRDHPGVHAARACSRSRSSRSPSCSSCSSASASGRTTCSRPGCRRSTLVFFAAATAMVVIPSTIQVFAWCWTMVMGTAALPDAAALHRRLHLHVRHRRAHRDHVPGDPVRPAGDGHLLRHRPLPLHHLRGRRLPDLRRHVLLVPEGHREALLRAAGADQLLDHLRRDEPALLPDAHRRAARDAAAQLHLSRAGSAGRPTTCSRRSAASSRSPGSCCCSGTCSSATAAARPPAPTRGTARRSSGRRARRRPSTTSRSSRRCERLPELGRRRPRSRPAQLAPGCSCSTRATSSRSCTPVDGYLAEIVEMPHESPGRRSCSRSRSRSSSRCS